MEKGDVTMNEAIIWLIICIALVVVEVGTMGLVTIWFALGAFIAMVSAMLGAPMWMQSTLFILISTLLLIFTRPVASKYFNKDRTRTNVDAMIGREGIVIETIQNLQARGTVTIGGQEWMARSNNANNEILEGSVVVVTAIEGVKVIVEEKGEY